MGIPYPYYQLLLCQRPRTSPKHPELALGAVNAPPFKTLRQCTEIMVLRGHKGKVTSSVLLAAAERLAGRPGRGDKPRKDSINEDRSRLNGGVERIITESRTTAEGRKRPRENGETAARGPSNRVV
jgi:hypothetical protein